MSILIKGMEMPKNGCHHIICIYADGTVSTGGRVYTAIPVLPHGRLIDADALLATERETFEDYHISDATTVIPAEEGKEDGKPIIDACHAAVDKYGADNQVKKAIEELAELQVELCHYLCGRGELGAISEEMADVRIMLEQLLIIFGNDNFVTEWEKVKAARLMERINADNKNSG